MLKNDINPVRPDAPNPFELYAGSRLLFLKIGILKMKDMLLWIVSFYLDGFRRMKLGRTLWAIILIKLLIMFGVLKLFFFPDFLHENFNSDTERADHVISQLTTIHTK